jgi:hypothetical protein
MAHMMADGQTPCGLKDGHGGSHRPPGYRERQNEQRRARRRDQPGYRERETTLKRERRNTSPEYRALEYARKRTPAYRKKTNARRRERYASDPEYREAVAARKRTPERRKQHAEREHTYRINHPDRVFIRDQRKAAKSRLARIQEQFPEVAALVGEG